MPDFPGDKMPFGSMESCMITDTNTHASQPWDIRAIVIEKNLNNWPLGQPFFFLFFSILFQTYL